MGVKNCIILNLDEVKHKILMSMIFFSKSLGVVAWGAMDVKNCIILNLEEGKHKILMSMIATMMDERCNIGKSIIKNDELEHI